MSISRRRSARRASEPQNGLWPGVTRGFRSFSDRASICSAACRSLGETLGVGRRPASVGGHTMASCASRCSVRPGSWLPSAPAHRLSARCHRRWEGPSNVSCSRCSSPNRTESCRSTAWSTRLWGDDPPETARHTVQSYVSELRKSLGSVITREGAGYKIGVDADTCDILDFESRMSAARALSATDPAGAAAMISEARSHCGEVHRSTTSVAVRHSRGRWRGWRNSAWPRSRK